MAEGGMDFHNDTYDPDDGEYVPNGDEFNMPNVPYSEKTLSDLRAEAGNQKVINFVNDFYSTIAVT